MKVLQVAVLIVPFMELKQRNFLRLYEQLPRLNRTFYGIETVLGLLPVAEPWVLIVPFMELKQGKDLLILLNDVGLNRTFYGIET